MVSDEVGGADARPFAGLRTLVVDDYETVRRRLTAALTKLGVAVVEAGDGHEALEILGRERFDIVLTDLVMPEMDGFELCAEIRASPSLRGLPIVVVSTHRDARHIVRALRLGADDYVPKPASAELLRKVLARVTLTLSPEA